MKRSVILSILAGLVVRVLIVGIGSRIADIPVSSLADAHDGKEYLAIAEAIGKGDLSLVSPEYRRLYPGYPLATALVNFILPLWMSGFVVTVLCVVLTIVFTDRLFGSDRITLAMAFVFPSWLYYTSFVMSEALFMALLLGALVLYRAKKHGLSFLVLSLAFMTRSVAVFLAVALLIDLWRKQKVKHAVCAAIVFVILPLAWYVTTYFAWKGSNPGYSPQFAFPFYPMVRFVLDGDAFSLKGIYVTSVVLFFTGTVCFETYRHFRGRGTLPLPYLVFVVLIVMFELSLYKMDYRGLIPVFVYQDRYMIPLLPFALKVWEPCLKRWVLVLLGIVSVGLSLYWCVNYLEAAKVAGTL